MIQDNAEILPQYLQILEYQLHILKKHCKYTNI